MIGEDTRLTVTFFTNVAAHTKQEREVSLTGLAKLIQKTSAPAKDRLPWIKLARFGALLSEKGSLRHDRNLITQTGVEADYDDERISFDDAVEIAEKAGLFCLIYTSPSHRPEAPRWRLLCPTSRELAPAQRAHMLARLPYHAHALETECFYQPE